jgi:peptide/nickel transport system permease protein
MSNEVVNLVPEVVTAPKKHSLLVDLVIRLVKEKPLGVVGGIIVLLLLFAGIFADFIAPYGMNDINAVDFLAPPSAKYILGADNKGRDLLSRIIFGARISVIVGLCATTISVLISTIIGVVCGFYGRKVDIVVQRFVDAWMCFPGLVLLIVIVSVLGPGLWQIILVLGLLYGIGGSRVVRSAVISIKENVYVEASKAIGCPTSRVMLRHILPNIMAPIIILFTTRMPTVILAEATLSFLGLGVPPPTPTWGGMLSGPGRSYMLMAPWMAVWPGLVLAIVVYGINMFGDAVRDLLDPRLRGGVGRYGLRARRAQGRAR